MASCTVIGMTNKGSAPFNFLCNGNINVVDRTCDDRWWPLSRGCVWCLRAYDGSTLR
jgi:hypothetical protein